MGMIWGADTVAATAAAAAAHGFCVHCSFRPHLRHVTGWHVPAQRRQPALQHKPMRTLCRPIRCQQRDVTAICPARPCRCKRWCSWTGGEALCARG